MKIQIDLGTVDVEMQRSDGTWEKVDHCHTRIRVEKSMLRIDLNAVLSDELRAEIARTMRFPKDADNTSYRTSDDDTNGDLVSLFIFSDDAGSEHVGCKPDEFMDRFGDRINAHGEIVDRAPDDGIGHPGITKQLKVE